MNARFSLLILSAAGVLLGLSGCGQKGPLVLPTPSSPAPATAASSPAAKP